MSASGITRLRTRIESAWPKQPPFPALDGELAGRPIGDIKKLLPRLRELVGRPVRLIVEVGGELGGSTRFFLNAFEAATVITIDPWPERYGHVARKWPKVAEFAVEDKHSYYRVFQSMNWQWRDRLLPFRTISGIGFPELFRDGIEPDVIYLDGLHTYHGCYDDLALSHFLFPNAVICGDDWAYQPGTGAAHFLGIDLPVRKAVTDFALTHGKLNIVVEGNSYIIEPAKAK